MTHAKRAILVSLAFATSAQLILWIAHGRASLADEAIDWYLSGVKAHAIRNAYDVDGELRAGTLLMDNQFADELGPARLAVFANTAADYNQSIELVDGWDGDRLNYHETFNSPLVAVVDVGIVAPGCSLMGRAEFVYLMGFWVRVPDRARFWGR